MHSSICCLASSLSRRVTRRARIGVVGAGWWATGVHLPALVGQADVDVIGIADVDGKKAELAANRYRIPRWFSSHQELLALDPDGVIVATPHDAHFQATYDSLCAGADVLVEKPMTIDVAEAASLVVSAEAAGRRLHIGYASLYSPHVRCLKERIESGQLGELVALSTVFATSVESLYSGNVQPAKDALPHALQAPESTTYGSRARGGGQLLTQVTHAAALLVHLTGAEFSTVFARLNDLDLKVDVVANVAFTTSEGAVGSIVSVGNVAEHDDRIEEYRLFGRDGHAALATQSGTLRIVSRDRPVWEPANLPHDQIYPASAPAKQLVGSLLRDEPVVATGELGLTVVRFLDAARRSAELGLPVDLSVKPPTSTGGVA